MERINLFIGVTQLSFLQDLSGHVSEHIRKAIDEYIVKLKNQNATTSPSKKGGESEN